MLLNSATPAAEVIWLIFFIGLQREVAYVQAQCCASKLSNFIVKSLVVLHIEIQIECELLCNNASFRRNSDAIRTAEIGLRHFQTSLVMLKLRNCGQKLSCASVCRH